MNVNRIIEVKERNTLGAVQDFMSSLLTREVVDALFVPQTAADGAVSAALVSHPDAIKRSNPFAPIMVANAAKQVAEATMKQPDRHIGAVLRPCEIRALVELAKRGRASLTNLTVVGIDCLGTFAPFDYMRRMLAAGGAMEMTTQCMQVAEEGEITCETRTACRMCERPAPRGADVTLGFIGVDAANELLVIAADESADARLRLDKVTDRVATEREVVRREATLTNIIHKHNAATDRELSKLEMSFGGLAGALTTLATCTECRSCLQACPLYDGELDDPRLSLVGQLGAVSRWLVSCSGCGMCEESCPNGVPLAVLARALSRPLRAKFDYTPGRSVEEKLPWAVA
jgi:formate dehydrogenase (coenzyme F420) beta subunit